MLYVNESGFYALVLGSKLSTAVKFKTRLRLMCCHRFARRAVISRCSRAKAMRRQSDMQKNSPCYAQGEGESAEEASVCRLNSRRSLSANRIRKSAAWNDVVDEQVVRNAKNGENIIQLENQVGNLLPKSIV